MFPLRVTGQSSTIAGGGRHQWLVPVAFKMIGPSRWCTTHFSDVGDASPLSFSFSRWCTTLHVQVGDAPLPLLNFPTLNDAQPYMFKSVMHDSDFQCLWCITGTIILRWCITESFVFYELILVSFYSDAQPYMSESAPVMHHFPIFQLEWCTTLYVQVGDAPLRVPFSQRLWCITSTIILRWCITESFVFHELILVSFYSDAQPSSYMSELVMHHSPFFQRLWCITSLPVSTDHSPLLLVAGYALLDTLTLRACDASPWLCLESVMHYPFFWHWWCITTIILL